MRPFHPMFFLKTLPVAVAICLCANALPSFAQNEKNDDKPLRITGGTKSVDLPEGSAEKIRIQVSQGRFSNQSAGTLNMEVDGINYRSGTLQRLLAEFQDALFDTIPVTYLQIESGAFQFDTFELLNHRRFVLNRPAQSTVNMRITEENLNHFMNHPKIIEKLENAVAKKTGNIRLVQFSSPKLDLLPGNAFKMNLTVSFGNAMQTPLQLDGKLSLDEGRVNFKDLNVTSQGTPLPVELAPIMESQLNKMFDFNRIAEKYFDIQAKTLKVTKTDLSLSGSATLKKLDIGL